MGNMQPGGLGPFMGGPFGQYNQPHNSYPGYGQGAQNVPAGNPQFWPQGYPPQGYMPSDYPPRGYPPLGYPQQRYPQQGYPMQQSGIGSSPLCATCLACITCLMCSCCQALMGVPLGENMDDESGGPPITGAGPQVVPPPLSDDN